MEVWTIANQKGGVGKTTTTVTLGGLLAAWGFRTLMIDIDPHASLSSYFGYDPDQLERSSFDVFLAITERRHVIVHDVILETQSERLHLIPATIGLAGLDRQSGRLEGMGLALKKALRQLISDYDYVLVDCPPVLGILLINALAACDCLIIPVQTEFLALKGLERMLHIINMVMRVRTAPLPYTIVPTFYDPRTRSSLETLAQLQRDHQSHLWSGHIPVDTKLRDASRAGMTPILYDPNSRAVLAYSELLATLRHQTLPYITHVKLPDTELFNWTTRS
ncbi:ParA family protein [Rhodoferax sp. 4810]|uniref:ParA family protein n=1 Tax=Thiospirillum jenense TaxID=1653858 RepID=A0A839HCZ5_9GAMM|nr:ParA family protein [Thiospirillum jenense]MBB1074547.1 ParA family protein [Rhodoferax jenense]MBB1126521.1 ParA family protein [Thiospirillum jenense]